MSRWLRTILPICVVVLIAEGAFSCWSISQFVRTVRAQNLVLALKARVDRLHRLVHHLESSQRSYLITNNVFYLEAYEDTLPNVNQELVELRLISENDLALEPAMSRLAEAVARKTAELQEAVELARNKNLVAAIRKTNADESILAMAEVTNALAELDAKAEADLQRHRRFVEDYSDSAVVIILTTTAVALALVLTFAWLTYREIWRRTRIAQDLERAQHAALVASKLKSQFLATVSHELRTPLNGIIGMSDILRGKLTGSEHRGLVDIIHQSGATLLKIVNDILDFSKIEAGKIDFEIADFSVQSVVESVAELLSIKAREKGISMLTYVDPRLPATLNGDPSRITQVLQNLVGNALKFTESGAVFIHAMAVSTEGRFQVRFEVHDTGVGIPEDKLPLLFQPFNQLQQVDNQREEGTGLGLSISKNLVERMDGSIGVSSQVGIGSTFWFTLPLRQVGAERTVDRFRLPRPPENVAAVLVGAGEFLRIVISSYLREMGIPLEPRASASPDIKRTLASASVRHLIVFLDLRWLGEAKARQILAQTADERVSFVAISRGRFDDTERLAFGPRVKGFLRAPFRREQIYAAVMQILDPESAQAEHRSFASDQGRKNEALGGREAGGRGNGSSQGLVLIAEDNPVNQTIAKIYIEQLGYRAHTVANGEEALEALSRIQYDLVFMDVQMPVMDGYEATRRIRRQESASGRHVPIVAMTANAIQGDREKCLAAGMDDYVSKPFQEGDIRMMLERWVGPGAAPVDWDVLRELAAKTNKDVALKLIKSFLTTLPNTLAEIRNARAALDRQQLRFWSHQLKSSSATLGAKNLSEACGRLEREAQEENAEARADLGSLADRLLALGEQALKEFREHGEARVAEMQLPPKPAAPRMRRAADTLDLK